MANVDIPHKSPDALKDPARLLENFKALTDRINDGSILLGATTTAVVFSATPNTTLLVSHTLGRIPTDWVITGVDKQANIFEVNKSSWTATQVQFRVAAVGINVSTQEVITARILLF